jgi:DNA-binding NarL/FixJ family response regulator
MKNITPLSIFIADDDPMFRTALKQNLVGKFGNSVLIAVFETGEDLIRHMNQYPDLVILDYYLQDDSHRAKTGLSFLKTIHFRYPETQVYLMSAQKDIDKAVEVIKCGAEDYLTKDKAGFQAMNLIVEEKLIDMKLDGKLKMENTKWKLMLISPLFILIIIYLITRFYS